MPKILGKTLIGDSNISFLDASLISVPNTQIQNRAQIRNLAADMAPRFGVDRIMTQSIYEVQNEIGPNGERVFGVVNDQLNLIRFVGTWVADLSSSQARGPFIWNTASTNLTSDYVEVVFYGTGLNLLTTLDNSARDFRVTVDGGAESANINTIANQNGVLNSRNYATNQIMPVVSGLAQGLHTVKIRNNGATSNDMKVYGFEVLNETSTVRVNAGTLIRDQRRFGLDAAQTLPTKPAAYTGTRGARVVVYNSGGQLSQVFNNAPASSAFLSSADHSSEDIIRRYNFREFGGNRFSQSDDIGSMGGSTRSGAYTLEDNTTTMLTSNGQVLITNGYEYLAQITAGNWILITFVGTGLDIVRMDAATSTDTIQINVDGTNVGNLSTTGQQTPRIVKICSGLPYGTHVVRLTNTNYAVNQTGLTGFITYGPKKPTVPSGALEIADYFVMADYVATSAAGVDNIGSGLLRKGTAREFAASGSGFASAFQTNGTRINGPITNQSGSSGAFFEYYFYGTGFEYRGQANGAYAGTINITANGSALTTTNFPAMVSSTLSGWSFNASTGVLSQNAGSQNGSGLSVKGLPLAFYKLRFTNNTTSEIQNESFDVITPIHAPKSVIPQDLQNALTVGNCALSDSRQVIRADAGQTKYRGYAQGITSGPSTSSTAYIPVPDLFLAVPSKGGWFEANFSADSTNSGTNSNYLAVFVDGVQVGPDHLHNFGNNAMTSGSIPFYLSPGVHQVVVMWKTVAGSATVQLTSRYLSVKEV